MEGSLGEPGPAVVSASAWSVEGVAGGAAVPVAAVGVGLAVPAVWGGSASTVAVILSHFVRLVHLGPRQI